MAFITWDSSYTIGVETIDFQHEKLVNILNNLADVIEKDEAPLVVEFTIVQLLNYTLYHFSYEEDLMKKVSFPNLQDHVIQHQAIKGRVQQFQKQIDEGKPIDGKQILNFITMWLTNHIQSEDKKFAPYVKQYEQSK